MSIRVLIVDDHAIVRQGLRLLLENQPTIEVVGEAGEGETAIQMAASLQPDIMLLDLIMPDLSGIDVLRKIQERGIQTRCLVLTSSADDHLIKQALQAGAHGYMLKTSRAADMVQAIERVAQGINVLDPIAAHLVMQQARDQDPLTSLTDRESEVFNLLARGHNNTEIAHQLVISEATIRTHLGSILDKLALRDRTQVMAYALKRGIVRAEDLV